MENVVAFEELPTADLIVDRLYARGSAGRITDDAIVRLLPGVGNQGGFRPAGSPTKGTARLVALYSTGEDANWPDVLDPYSGDFVYYGDNKEPGRELHDTPRSGNLLMRDVFNRSHGSTAQRQTVPPFLLFDKPGTTRAVRFRGLLAPGSPRLSHDEELVAIWRTTNDQRFQNYRAHFTVLDVQVINRQWIKQILDGDPLGSECPDAWRSWCQSRTYRPLEAPRTLTIRNRAQQLPTGAELAYLTAIYEHFKPKPTEFEQFAADVFKMSEPQVSAVDVTRPWRDGGRDAVGVFRIGPKVDPISVEFALEAKCYKPGNGVGVEATSRLISRLRHRQFGALVTTSYLADQAYHEIRDDEHPVVVIAGRDLVEILKGHGYENVAAVRSLLEQEYPLPAS